MNILSAAARLIQNASADKANRRRGEESLRQREVEALERIASAVTSQNYRSETP